MKILQINTVYAQGSTGKIVKEIEEACYDKDIQCISACRYSTDTNAISISSRWDSRIHGWIARFTMFKGIGSFIKTLIFLKKVNQYNPDVIHLHNLHGSYINLPLLFRYIKKYKIRVIWTLHDCWSFTAICSHFTISKCNKWKTGCNHCPQRWKYSSSLFDLTRYVWKLKKKLFLGIDNITIITPSKWLKEKAENSFLMNYPVKNIYNGINLDIFKPTSSCLKEKYGIVDKKIVLGVSFIWNYSKGIDVFEKIAERLPSDYVIILVGTTEELNKKLPKNIISIPRTNNQIELAKIYTIADVFFNPTREEVLGLVNIEALACGTPVITFNSGGSPECIDESCGVVIENESLDCIERHIKRICELHPYDLNSCINRAKMFDKNKKINEYIDLYMSIN